MPVKICNKVLVSLVNALMPLSLSCNFNFSSLAGIARIIDKLI